MWVGVLVGATAAAGYYSLAPEGVRSLFGGSVLVDGWLVVACVLIFAAPVAAWAVIADERPTALSSAVKLSGVGATIAALLTVAVLAVREGLMNLDAQPRIGTPTADAALPFLLAGAAVLVLTVLVAAVRWPRAGRPVVVAISAGLLALAASVGAAGAVASSGTGCDAFRFSTERWNAVRNGDDGRTMAESIGRCHVLLGQGRAQVVRMLGPATPRLSRTRVDFLQWALPEHPDDFFSPVEDDHLSVHLDTHGRVDRVRFVEALPAVD